MDRVLPFGRRFWLLALILAGWQILAATRLLDPLFFPSPASVAGTLIATLRSGEMERAIAATLARAGTALFIGILCGGVASVLLCLFKGLRIAAQPLISALYSTPRLTMLPMVMLIFGVNDVARLTLVSLSVALVIVIQISDAIRAVNQDYLDLASNYGATGAVLVRRVYLPACLPQIFTSLRLCTGRALVTTISVEMLSSKDGIGSMIWSAWDTFATEKLYASVVVAATLGLLSGPFFRALERHFVPWRSDAR